MNFWDKFINNIYFLIKGKIGNGGRIMKEKIIGFLLVMLLMIAGNIVVADWTENDGHKMHYPQTPDENGYDVEWGYWSLGDDWLCSESGTVDDIHFWVSWQRDNVHKINSFYVSIWSNDPEPPSKIGRAHV